jgi:hypothetical protein
MTMSQFTFPQRRAIIKGLLSASSPTKQELGRRLAYFLGFTPGPKGPDDGIDGLIEENGFKIHFQSKLSANKLNVDEAKKYYSDIKYHGVKISIMLAGVGYTKPFCERLFSHNDINHNTIHLLTLEDIFSETERYEKAINDLPRLNQLQKLDWSSYQ